LPDALPGDCQLGGSEAITSHVAPEMLRATILPMLRRGYQRASYWAKVFRQSRNTPPRECPLCGFRGRFVTVGLPPRFGALCPKCKSLERHRLIYLALRSNPISQGASILHFAIGDQCVRYGLLRGERVFFGSKPQSRLMLSSFSGSLTMISSTERVCPRTEGSGREQ